MTPSGRVVVLLSVSPSLPEPKYLAKNITLACVESVGNNGKHLKLLVKHNSSAHRKMIGFNFGDENKVGKNWCEFLKPGDLVDVVFGVSVNQWNGNRELQLKIVDLKMVFKIGSLYSFS